MTSVRLADLADDADGDAIIALLDAYSRDPMGDGKPLDPAVRERLVPGLRAHPTTLVFLAFVDDRPVGIATTFVGFSTFAARPLLNLHDVAVLIEARGNGVGRALLRAVAAEARRRRCCKLTLEVLENNTPARRLYESFGFRQATYAEGAGGALFYACPIAD